MQQPYNLTARAAHTLRRALLGYAPLLLVLLLPWVAPAQAPTTTVTPAGLLPLGAGTTPGPIATAIVPGFNGTVNAVVVQADGKVLVGGDFTSYNGNANAPDYLLRLNRDGSLDTTFNNGPTAGTDEAVFALALQANGKVLAGGYFTAYNGNPRAPDHLLRLNRDGSLDQTFNSGATGANGAVFALAVQAGGRVLVGGAFTSYNGNPSAPDRLLRLHPNGSLDTGFNNGVTAGANGSVFALAVQAGGWVLVGGTFTAYNGNANAPDNMMRINANGSLDQTFNSGATGANDAVFALAMQADGRLLAGGAFTAYNGNAKAPNGLLRLTTDGSLDTTFNNGSTAGANSAVFALAVQADGKVLVGGAFTAYNGNANAPDYLLCLNADGSLDQAFNPATTGVDDAVFALAGPAGGNVLVGGAFTSCNGNAPSHLRCLSADSHPTDPAVPLTGAASGFPSGTTADTSSALRNDNFLEKQLPQTPTSHPPLYHRPKPVDAGDTFGYAPLRPGARARQAARPALYPNPAPGGAVTLTGVPPGAMVTVTDALGRSVTAATADAAGTAALALPARCPVGVHVVRAGSKTLRLTVE